MTDPDTVSADYTLRPSELAATLALLVEARQPTILWGAPGCAKSALAQQTAAGAARRYVDVRALLLDPVDLRGIPWRDTDGRTRWAPPAFLPPAGDPGRWLINLEELPSAVPMVQAALYQLVLDRKVGEYELPEGASLIACGNRESDRGVVHRMPTPLASRFVHLEIRVDAEDWLAWGAANGIAPEVLFYIQMRPDLLHAFDPQAKEKAFCCPRTSEWDDLNIDLTPRDAILSYLTHAFPVQLQEPFTDDGGNLLSRPARDTDGNPVICKEAEDRRDALIEKLAALPPVPTALDQIVQHFGHEAVAEVTGRSRRVLRITDAKGERLALRSRPASANLAETAAFMDATKRILVFSMAGGTGRSYHADLSCANTERHIHYLLEPGWRADQAIQGLGRTHRTHRSCHRSGRDRPPRQAGAAHCGIGAGDRRTRSRSGREAPPCHQHALHARRRPAARALAHAGRRRRAGARAADPARHPGAHGAGRVRRLQLGANRRAALAHALEPRDRRAAEPPGVPLLARHRPAAAGLGPPARGEHARPPADVR